MPLYHAVGNALVSQDELDEKAATIALFEQLADQPVEFANGILSQEVPAPQTIDSNGQRIPFRPIGPGKPLTVQLRQVFRGAHPRRAARKSMLVTSAMKPIGQSQAEARAVNFLVKRLGTRKGFSQVPATDPGTPIVYYSPALTELAMSLTVDVGFNDVPGDDIRNFGTLLQKAGAIPAFIAHSAFLIGAGLVTKLAAKVAELAETQPVLSDTAIINFVTPGQKASLPGFKILAPEDFPDDFLNENQVNDLGQLTDSTGHAYDGDLPYVTLSLDGTDRPDLKNFEATQASAAMLADYFAVNDGYPQELQLALDALQLYSDLQFRQKADKIKGQMDELGSGDQFDKLNVMYDAYIKNINEDALRPS